MKNIYELVQFYGDFISYFANRGTIYNIYTLYKDNKAYLIIENDKTKEIVFNRNCNTTKDEYIKEFINFSLEELSKHHALRSLGLEELNPNDRIILSDVLNNNQYTNILKNIKNKNNKLVLSNSTINFTTFVLDEIKEEDLRIQLIEVLNNLSNRNINGNTINSHEILNIEDKAIDKYDYQFKNIIERLLPTFINEEKYTINLFYSEGRIHIIIKDINNKNVLHISELCTIEDSISKITRFIRYFNTILKDQLNLSYFTNLDIFEKELIDTTRENKLKVNYDNKTIKEGNNTSIKVFNIKANNITLKYIIRHEIPKEIELIHKNILETISNKNIEQNKKLVK